jgi:allantoin racemase
VKLWYQSLTRTSAWQGYNLALRRCLDRFAAPGTTIEITGIEARGGIGDQYRYLEFIEAAEVLGNVIRAERDGFDAFLIGNIADPGLREARELATIPVIGLGETSMHLATMMGANFGLVTGNEKHAPKITENVGRYGLSSSLAGVRRMRVDRLVDLDTAFTDPAVRQALVAEFLGAARALVDEGAEVVIPAIGVLATLLAEEGVHSVDGRAPIANGVMMLIKMAEAAVSLRGLMGGHWTSRRAMYAQPPLGQIAELRRFYGDIYPGLETP